MYTVEEAQKLVIEAGKRLLEKGLIARTWGNISARISDTQFVITPSGKAYETLTPADIVTVNIEDCTYEGNVKPSSEKGVHAEAYRLRKNVNFVIHTHQVNASAISIMGQDITELDKYGSGYKMILGGRIPCAEYGLSATEKLRKAVASQIERHKDSTAILMRHHGALCMGKDFDDSFAISASLEDICGKIYDELCKIHTIEASNSYICMETRRGEVSKIQVKTPYILEMSRIGKDFRPYLDDQAQIIGTRVTCVREHSKIARALKNSNAVLLCGEGAICSGLSKDEAMAACLVLEKGCKAALLAETIGKINPVNFVDAYKERLFYLKSYSKLK